MTLDLTDAPAQRRRPGRAGWLAATATVALFAAAAIVVPFASSQQQLAEAYHRVVETRFISAENSARITYRLTTDAFAEGAWGPDAPSLLSEHFSAAIALARSHAAEETLKAGPLYDDRKAVEAFARSIAGGVMLDFEWKPTVGRYGTGDSYGGSATWNTAHGGYSTVTLSDSVAAQWRTNPAVASLVAHEVGHSVTGKCMELFMSGFDAQAEVFATAWAIGLGYDLDGSGESIYGRPSDAHIELSTQCR